MGLFGNKRKGLQSNINPTSLWSSPSPCPPTDHGVEYKFGINGRVFSLTSTQDTSKIDMVETDDSFHGRSSRTCQPLSPYSLLFGDSSLSNIDHSALSGRAKHFKSKSDFHVTLDHVPDLILDLESAVETSARRPARALRKLLALSEPADGPNEKSPNQNRIEMVHRFNHTSKDDKQEEFHSNIHTGALVPALLRFLQRCKHNSNVQYLSLLVLNNISVPLENKRTIAIDHGGAFLLAQLLVEDPSCHLLAIILANLTLSNRDVINDLLAPVTNSDETKASGLVESLAFTLRMASLTKNEYEERIAAVEECNVEETDNLAQRLVLLLAEDQRLRVERSDPHKTPAMTQPSQQLFPETTRWCLSALRNLTRASVNSEAAHILIRSSIISLILQFIAVADSSSSSAGPSCSNSPSSWYPNSIQDAALSIVMNLSACSSSREYISDIPTIKTLSDIVGFPNMLPKFCEMGDGDRRQMKFQCLKARMALSYLIGAQEKVWQSQIMPFALTINAKKMDSRLVMSQHDIYLFLELLDNTLHRRWKEGPGGYSSATFSVKDVLFALRCFLSHTTNQRVIAKQVGNQLNALLIMALAYHTFYPSMDLVDGEAAEYACFCLYLQSNYGFERLPFLPFSMKSSMDDEVEYVEDISTRILSSYQSLPSISVTGRHAATQLLLRFRHLKFEDRPVSEVSVDIEWDAELLRKIKDRPVASWPPRVKPSFEISSRPIVPMRKSSKHMDSKLPWKEMTTVTNVSKAMQMVEKLSYRSSKVHNVVEDIDVAKSMNHVTASANGERLKSFGDWWAYTEGKSQDGRNHDYQESGNFKTNVFFHRLFKRLGWPKEGDRSFFQYSCAMCAADTTVL